MAWRFKHALLDNAMHIKKNNPGIDFAFTLAIQSDNTMFTTLG